MSRNWIDLAYIVAAVLFSKTFNRPTVAKMTLNRTEQREVDTLHRRCTTVAQRAIALSLLYLLVLWISSVPGAGVILLAKRNFSSQVS